VAAEALARRRVQHRHAHVVPGRRLHLQVLSSPPSLLPSHQNQNRNRKRFAHARRRLSLSQSGVPHMDAQGNTDVIDNVKKGWQSNFFER
jgi:hypothetical protein